jgi:hypothetical protein
MLGCALYMVHVCCHGSSSARTKHAQGLHGFSTCCGSTGQQPVQGRRAVPQGQHAGAARNPFVHARRIAWVCMRGGCVLHLLGTATVILPGSRASFRLVCTVAALAGASVCHAHAVGCFSCGRMHMWLQTVLRAFMLTDDMHASVRCMQACVWAATVPAIQGGVSSRTLCWWCLAVILTATY